MSLNNIASGSTSNSYRFHHSGCIACYPGLDNRSLSSVSLTSTHVIAPALVRRHQDLVRRCGQQARGALGRPGYTSLLDGLARLHKEVLHDDLVARLPLEVQSSLSVSASRLGDLATEHGRLEEANAILAGALSIDERRHRLVFPSFAVRGVRLAGGDGGVTAGR